MRIPATYTDALGSLEADLRLEQGRLALEIGGQRFESLFFDDFEPTEPLPTNSRFRVCKYNFLTDCVLDCRLRQYLYCREGEYPAELRVKIRFSNQNPARPAFDADLELEVLGMFRASVAGVDLFELGFKALAEQLPTGWGFKNCFGCAWSDYHVAGQGFWGGLLCFRDQAAAYQQVTDKDSYMDFLDSNDCTEQVGENHCCPRFAPRAPQTGYRG